FSSRRRHTRWPRDWSSDVCSSDLVRGHGYSLMWQEGKSEERIEWGPGSVFVPPEMWFHQHFNGSAEPVFFLAIGWGSDKPKAGEIGRASCRERGEKSVVAA